MSCANEPRELGAILSAPPETLSSEQIERILEHADECRDCSAGLRDLAARAITAQSPPVRLDSQRSARIRERVLAQAVRERAPVVVPISRAPRTRQRRASGWLAAAALAVALLTHHGFHEPLSSGWLVAAGFAAVALALGSYALSQKRRAEALEDEKDARRVPPGEQLDGG
jgi:hypothetical protein